VLFYGAGLISGQKDLELYVRNETQNGSLIGVENILNNINKHNNIATTPFCIYTVAETRKTNSYA
ncbi:hypothetical protein, partial [Oceanihabitans sediminis]|uniref:hypothetical protein n=1 Tax=Oceanihabitans sediminis TaxID=1812012 RepID=UPI00299D8072